MIAGVWIAPAASATARDRTVTLCPSTVIPSTPRAAPPSSNTRSTGQFTTIRAPLSEASCSHVFIVDCFAPIWHP